MKYGAFVYEEKLSDQVQFMGICQIGELVNNVIMFSCNA
jgi:hypothetical protein